MKISCRFEISFRSKRSISNPYRFEFHFTSIHVNTSKELTEHRSEIFNRNEISYRFEFISLLMWTYSKLVKSYPRFKTFTFTLNSFFLLLLFSYIWRQVLQCCLLDCNVWDVQVVVCRCSSKRVLLKILQNSQENTLQSPTQVFLCKF